MKIKAAALAVLLLNMTQAAVAEDPYGKSVKEFQARGKKEEYKLYLEGIQIYWFAYGCKVFNSEGGFARAVAENQLRYINQVVEYDELMRDSGAAARKGLDRSKGGCEIFRSNPELVVTLREYGQAGIMP